MSDLLVSATFTHSTGVPATGLALADIDLYLTAVNKSTGADTVIWDGTQNPTEEIDNIGSYLRIYEDDADFETYDYFARGTYTGATVLDVDHVTGAFSSEASLIWAHSTRTLTQSAASVAATVAGDTITVIRGDTLSISLTGLGSLAGYVSLDFSVKATRADTDDNAIIRIRLNASGLDDGLLRLNGAAATDATAGSITIDDAGAGNITIALDADESAQLVVKGYYYDVQMITATTVGTLTEGPLLVDADVTRSTS